MSAVGSALCAVFSVGQCVPLPCVSLCVQGWHNALVSMCKTDANRWILRCDAGAPTHALLSAPRWGGPPSAWGLLRILRCFWHGPLGAWGRVAPRRKPTSWDGLAPGLLALCSSLTGVVVVAGPWTRAAAHCVPWEPSAWCWWGIQLPEALGSCGWGPQERC